MEKVESWCEDLEGINLEVVEVLEAVGKLEGGDINMELVITGDGVGVGPGE